MAGLVGTIESALATYVVVAEATSPAAAPPTPSAMSSR